MGFGGLALLGTYGGHRWGLVVYLCSARPAGTASEMRPICTVLVIEESYSTRALAGANKWRKYQGSARRKLAASKTLASAASKCNTALPEQLWPVTARLPSLKR